MEFGTGRGMSAIGRFFLHGMKIKRIPGGRLRTAFYAPSRQPARKPLHMVVDSEWVYKGVQEWGGCRGGVISGAWPLGTWLTEICGSPFWIWCRHGETCFQYNGLLHT